MKPKAASVAAPIVGLLLVALAGAQGYSWMRLGAEKRQVQRLAGELGQMQQRLAEVDRQLDAVRKMVRRAEAGELAPLLDALKEGDAKPGEDLAAAVARQGKVLHQIGQILSALGLDKLAANEKLNPDFLKEAHDRYAARVAKTDYQQKLASRFQEGQQADLKVYGEQISNLYRAALTGASDGNAAAADGALTQLLQQYPSSYSTAAALAQRAMSSLMQGNHEDVQRYYDMLRDNPNAASVVTENGVEAVPTLMAAMARQSMAENPEDAQRMIDALEQGYAESYVVRPGSSGQRELVPISTVVDTLRQLASGQTPAGPAGGGARPGMMGPRGPGGKPPRPRF